MPWSGWPSPSPARRRMRSGSGLRWALCSSSSCRRWSCSRPASGGRGASLARSRDAQGNDMKYTIRVLLAGEEWSLAELAERVGVSRHSIIAIGNARFDPSEPLAFRIADAFGLLVEEVFDKASA